MENFSFWVVYFISEIVESFLKKVIFLKKIPCKDLSVQSQ